MWSPSYSVVIFSLIVVKLCFSSPKPTEDGQLKVGNFEYRGESNVDLIIKQQNDLLQDSAFPIPSVEMEHPHDQVFISESSSSMDGVNETADHSKDYRKGGRKIKTTSHEACKEFTSCPFDRQAS